MIKYASLTLLAGLLLLGSFSINLENEQEQEKESLLTDLVFHALEAIHYSEVDINDDYSSKAFDLYLESLDGSKRFLTRKDVQQLEKYRYKLDDAVNEQSFEFFNTSNELITKRIREAEAYYQEILNSPFDFTEDETVETDATELHWAKNEKELKERWRKFLKFRVLTQMVNRLERQEKQSDQEKVIEDTVEVLTVEEIEIRQREKVRDNHENLFSRLSKIERSDRFAAYMNALVSVYDPHTAFYPPKDKENFDIAMSGQLEGIGATLEEREGYIKVSRIVPGSASWKQGELEAGDLILAVGQGEEEPVDIVDMRLDKAVQLIRGKKGTEVRLTVKKIDGTIKIIPIIRDVVVLEETYAKSAILQRDEKPYVGYLHLPSFYADFQNKKGRQSGKDVKAEIEKLKEDNIQGLILDLRNNGGGSLQDVVEMGGLFIDKGPIVQVKPRGRDPHILRDNDRGVEFDKPLIILVNKFSASASEILAAAMQDYDRAIIIGANATFGKGTVQQFYDLDRFVTDNRVEDLKPLGSLKITTQKFYRIDGGTTQLRGVRPDIVLPDAYNFVEIGEKELKYPIEWTEINSANYEQWDATYNEQNLINQSNARVSSDTLFQKITDNAERLKRKRDESVYSLNLEKYRSERNAAKKEAKKYDKIDKHVQDFTIHTLTVDQTRIDTESDTIGQERMLNWFKNVQTDVYINEALSVMYDMQSLEQIGKKED